jgi:hypothetical protein
MITPGVMCTLPLAFMRLHYVYPFLRCRRLLVALQLRIGALSADPRLVPNVELSRPLEHSGSGSASAKLDVCISECISYESLSLSFSTY